MNYLSNLSKIQFEIFNEIFEKWQRLEKDISDKTSRYYLHSIFNFLEVWLNLPSKNIDNDKLKYFLHKLDTFDIKEISDISKIFFLLQHILVFLDSKDYVTIETVKRILAKLPLPKYQIKHEDDELNTQKIISKMLTNMGYMFQEGYDIGIYSLDFLLKPNLVLEYHGVTHYYYGTRELMKDSLLKQRYLDKLNYKYIIIPYYDWKSLENNEKQEKYMKNIIEIFEK